MMPRHSIIFVGLLALAGCNPARDLKAEHLARENDSTIVSPAGRYQVVPVADSTGVYVLDTRFATIAQCGTTAYYKTWCTKPVNAMSGDGPPPLPVSPGWGKAERVDPAKP